MNDHDEDRIDNALSVLGWEEPSTAPNPAAPKPKCRRHDWMRMHDGERGYASPPQPVEWTECVRCGSVLDERAQRRGKNNRQRGNAIEREIGKKLGMKRVGQFGGKDDLSNALFAAQVKSGGAFSERQWAWLKAVPVIAGQTQLLVVADTPGPGKKRRALVILDLDAWAELHTGEADNL
jgi:hypothetical protein